jgi:hypothetical protein
MKIMSRKWYTIHEREKLPTIFSTPVSLNAVKIERKITSEHCKYGIQPPPPPTCAEPKPTPKGSSPDEVNVGVLSIERLKGLKKNPGRR